MNTWSELEEKFKPTTNKPGKPIDSGLFRTVVVFNTLGISTRMSCEGYLDHGLPCLWIDILGMLLDWTLRWENG